MRGLLDLIVTFREAKKWNSFTTPDAIVAAEAWLNIPDKGHHPPASHIELTNRLREHRRRWYRFMGDFKAPQDSDLLNDIEAAIEALAASAPPQAQQGHDGASWQPIKTRPDSDDPCWIADGPTGTMLVARPGRRSLKGVWYTMWTDRMVPWSPTHWMPLPEPPTRVIADVETKP